MMSDHPMKTLKILSLLLSYPRSELQEAAAEFPLILGEEGQLDAGHRDSLMPLIRSLSMDDLMELQVRYVDLFDRSRALTLHLFEHIHGESRDRGQALVDLGNLYARHGFLPDEKELPDYLPLLLEFLSQIDPAEARELLAQTAHIITALEKRLAERESIYRPVFTAIRSLAEWQPGADDVAEVLAEPDDDPDDFARLDEAWEETAVTFGPGDAGACPHAMPRPGQRN